MQRRVQDFFHQGQYKFLGGQKLFPVLACAPHESFLLGAEKTYNFKFNKGHFKGGGAYALYAQRLDTPLA